MVTVALIIVYPLYLTIKLSLREVQIYDILNLSNVSPTLENYVSMMYSPLFWRALRASAVYTASVTGVSFLIGLGTALLLNKRFRGRKLARSLVVLPWAIPAAITGMIWMWIFEAQFGVANFMLKKVFSVPSVRWLFSPTTALGAVITVSIWKNYPFFTLMLLAGLQTIPGELYEAAEVDGASIFRQFASVTLPALRPVIAVSVILSTLWAFRHFDIIYVMTGGGPARRTETLAVQIYQESFKFFNVGYASALGVISLIVSITVVVVFMRLLMKEFY
jgi:multiple sugar transport system permease protein